jgi:hypothetical protein
MERPWLSVRVGLEEFLLVLLCASFEVAVRVGIERALSKISASVNLEGAYDGCASDALLGVVALESLRFDEDSSRFEDHGAIAKLSVIAEHPLQIAQDGVNIHLNL